MKSKGHINSMKDFAARDLHELADKFSRKRNLDKLLDRKRAFMADARSTHQSEPWFWPSLGAVTLIGFGSLAIWMSTLSIPSLSTFEERASSNSTTIYDRTGEIILYDVVASAERTEVKSEYMAPVMKKAVVAAEDAKFYEHKGVRIDSTLRGVTNTVLSKLGAPVRGSGGSTITQQVLKNTILTSDKSVVRKVKEWILATKLEQAYTKDEILTIYLNEVPFGGNIYGVEAAARHFYGTTANKLTTAQAAYLAAIVNRPSYLSPYGKRKNELEYRKNYVLKEMLQNNLITLEEYTAANTEQVVFLDRKDNTSKALHFVEYVRQQIERQYGSEAMTTGGFKVITTLNWDIQKAAEEAANKHALENEKAYNASNAGVVVIQPGTGDILAMVGSRGYEDPAIDGKYNVTLAKRQPGSSFKSVVYAAAFEMGYTPDTVLFDAATQFGSKCEPDNTTTTTDGRCYAPDNYDGLFKGPISLRRALAESRNIPAVKLLYLVTPTRTLQLAKTLGMQSLGTTGLYGLSLVLGGGEVRPLDITAAYAAFAADGVYTPAHGILKIQSKSDNADLYTHTSKPIRAVSAEATRMLTSVLADPEARRPLSGNALNGFGVPVAAKTGTTNNNRDAWLLGYTPDIAVGVWCGNNDNTPMKKGSSITIPLWRDVMSASLRTVPRKTAFKQPAPIDPNLPPVLRGHWYGNETFVVDTISNKLATDLTPPETRKEYIMGTPQTILAYVTPGNARGGIGDLTSQMYQSWNHGVQQWIQDNPDKLPETATVKPTEYDDVHTEANKIIATLNPITEPLTAGNQTEILYQATAKYPLKSIQVMFNDEVVTQSDQVTGSIPVLIPDQTGVSILRIIVTDVVFNKTIVELPVTIQ
jgi:penicillin-binding protein 1C